MRKHASTLVTVLLALTFLVTGGSKVLAVPPSPENFERWQLPMAFMYAVGTVEVVAGLALLVRPVAPYAAGVLVLVMLGAIRTGIVYREALHVVLPAVLIAMLAFTIRERRCSGSGRPAP